MKYRKKPVIIEAIQLTENNIKEVYEFINPHEKTVDRSSQIAHDSWVDYERLVKTNGMNMYTLESGKGTQIASIGDFIIKGVKGEFYPCKPDIFELTYEPVHSLTAPVPDGKVCKRDELISFGKYLLSKERRDLIKFHPELEDKHFLQRYSSVSDADIANWKDNELFKNP